MPRAATLGLLGLLAAAEPAVVLRAVHARPERLADVQNRRFPGSIPEASPLTLSLFSTLFRDPSDPPDVFWSAPDRGPNDEVEVDGETRRSFLAPGYDPPILRVRVDRARHEIRVEEAIYLKTRTGEPVSGLPSRPGVDEAPFDASGRTPLDLNPNGLDPEALVRTAGGGFWMAEDYGPSLVRVGRDGEVLTRYVPAGSGIASPGYAVAETLPAVLRLRRTNRGFESLALSPDGRLLFAIEESPLANPDRATGEASRLVRLLVVDAETGRPRAEHVVVAAPGAEFGGAPQSEMKIADADCVNGRLLLAVERTDAVARVVTLDLRGATDILGSAWDDPGSRPALESLKPEELAARGLMPVAKAPLVDLSALVPDLPAKIEGLAIVDASTIAVGNDNEFAARAGAAASELIYVRLPRPLPLERPGREP